MSSDISSGVSELHRWARHVKEDHQDAVEGPPQNLERLFSLTSKVDVKRCAASMVVSGEDLFQMITRCSEIGYVHRPRFATRQPDHLTPTRTEIAGLALRDRSPEQLELQNRVVRKLRQIFEERTLTAFHFFFAPERWHLIFFTQKDARRISENHWSEGPHIHFINYLWGPTCDPRKLWRRFPDRPKKSVHIRLVESH